MIACHHNALLITGSAILNRIRDLASGSDKPSKRSDTLKNDLKHPTIAYYRCLWPHAMHELLIIPLISGLSGAVGLSLRSDPGDILSALIIGREPTLYGCLYQRKQWKIIRYKLWHTERARYMKSALRFVFSHQFPKLNKSINPKDHALTTRDTQHQDYTTV